MGVAERQPGTGARIDKRLFVCGLLSLTHERLRSAEAQSFGESACADRAASSANRVQPTRNVVLVV